MHAVNGYCELLALTSLTEEQSLYVTSIQQACHAINVIAGNVLGTCVSDNQLLGLTVISHVRCSDFSKVLFSFASFPSVG